jgi:hypothetical protein
LILTLPSPDSGVPKIVGMSSWLAVTETGTTSDGAGTVSMRATGPVLPTTEETVWATRGPIWARIWATRSEEEDEEEEVGLRIRRESSPEERELEDDWPEESEEEEDEDSEEREEELWPATAVDTVWEMSGWIWARIWEIRAS